MASIEEILKRAKPRVKTVPICLDGELRGEHETLSAELARVQRESAGKLSGDGEARQIAQRIQAVESEIAKATQEFAFRGLSDFALEALMEKFPARKGKQESWNFAAGAAALVAATAADPVMTEEQAEALRRSLAQADWDQIVATAWEASTKKDSIPFSVRASALMSGSGSK